MIAGENIEKGDLCYVGRDGLLYKIREMPKGEKVEKKLPDFWVCCGGVQLTVDQSCICGDKYDEC